MQNAGREALAYDEELAARIRSALGTRSDITEKQMFGGLAFLLRGSMFCGVSKDELMLRVGPERHDEALAKPHVRPMDFTGRPMKGYVFVSASGCRTNAAVASWVTQCAEYVATLPRKNAKPKAARLPSDHERAALLRHDGLVITLQTPHPAELASARFTDFCVEHDRAMAPLHTWLHEVIRR